MYSLINSNFNRTYNPSGKQNVLCHIKRLLTSRDTTAQAKACEFLIGVISPYDKDSEERISLVQYLLDNDITVFLCEVTCNLDFNLFRSVLQCLRLVWSVPRFFREDHSPHAMSTVLRAMNHFTAINLNYLETCLHFLCDLLNGISLNKTPSPLSYQSAYSTDQLLASFSTLASRINIMADGKSILLSALVLQELISYQPEGLIIPSSIAKSLVDVVKKWLEMLLAGLNHTALIGKKKEIGMLLIVTCQIAIDSLGLIKIFEQAKPPTDFVTKILADEKELDNLKQCSKSMKLDIHRMLTELVVFVKDNIQEIATEVYSTFIKLLLHFYYETNSEALFDFSDALSSKGYLSILPKEQIERNNITLRKTSTLLLGEVLKVLSEKYLCVQEAGCKEMCSKDIHMGLNELQKGLETPQNIGPQLQKNEPYSLLIFIYFYCQYTENPETATAPLLPHLVEYILSLPKSFKPPSYIIKAVWLVFAMSTISSRLLGSLDQRVYLDKASERLIAMLQPRPEIYYTHNPAILFWSFSSQRISQWFKLLVLCQWLRIETSLPNDLAKEPLVWALLLDVVLQTKDADIVSNCMKALSNCMEEDDELKEKFGNIVWAILPRVLYKSLVDCENEIDTNICHILDIAVTLPPAHLDQDACYKTALLTTTLYSKRDITESEAKYQFHYVCLKLSLLLLQFSCDQNDSRVLLIFTHKSIFMSNVISSSYSGDEDVACAALQLLSYLIHYYHMNNFEPESYLKMRTDFIIRSLREDSSSERTSSLLELIGRILSSGFRTPLLITHTYCTDTPTQVQEYNALRALMFRVQITLCYRDSENRTSVGWKTLTIIFKHTIVHKNDPNLVKLLTSQPWIFTLIRFQVAQELSEDFVNFLQSWLKLFKIYIKKSRIERKTYISNSSLITRTMALLKKSLGEKHAEASNTVEEILYECLDRK